MMTLMVCRSGPQRNVANNARHVGAATGHGIMDKHDHQKGETGTSSHVQVSCQGH